MATVGLTAGSGSLDIQSIVGALTKQQDIKIGKLKEAQKSYEVQISELGRTRSKISGLSDAANKVDAVSASMTQDQVKGTVKGFVEAYNAMKDQSTKSNQMTVKNLTSKVRAELDPETLKGMGVSFDRNGRANFNESTFDANYVADSAGVVSKAQSVFDTLKAKPEVFDNLLKQDGGSLIVQEKTYQNKITRVQKEQEQVERQKEIVTKTYTAQYVNLQNMLNEMNNRQQSLGQLLGRA